MVGSIGGTSNLIQILSANIQQKNAGTRPSQGAGKPPPPRGSGTNRRLQQPPGGSFSQAGPVNKDPLGVFSAVDQNSDGTVSQSEYLALKEGIANVTGNEVTGSFDDYDTNGNGTLNGAELKTVLDQAGFTPPPAPPSQAIGAYETQKRESPPNGSQLQQLVDYLQTQSIDLDVQA
jgi:EF hand